MLGGYSFPYVSFTFSSELLPISSLFSIALLYLHMPHCVLLEEHWCRFILLSMEEGHCH